MTSATARSLPATLVACVGLATAWLGSAPVARAQRRAIPPVAHFEQDGAPASERLFTRPIEVDLVLGLGSPVGFIGAQLGYAPAPWLVAKAGLGYSHGPQGDLSVAARAPMRDAAVGLEGGVSLGPYEQQPSIADALTCVLFLVSLCSGHGAGRVLPNVWEPAVWGHFALTVEYRYRRPIGLLARFALGYQILLNDSAARCGAVAGSGDVCAEVPSTTGLMLVSFAMGYTFDV